MLEHPTRLLLLVAFPLAVAAQEGAAPPEVGGDPTAHRHLGAFFRAELGSGHFTSALPGVTVSRWGTLAGLAAGGAFREDCLVGAQAWGASVSSDGETTGLSGYGALFSWYYQPGNAYLALTPSLTRRTFSAGDGIFQISTHSDWGLGLRAAGGREWWLSSHWGLGLGGWLAVSRNRAGAMAASGQSWNTAIVGVVGSATYN